MARVYNFADLMEGLEEKQIRCYVTDFPTEELLGHPGVLAIPHLGASTPESEDNCARMAAAQLVDYLENGNITNSVNLPAVSMPRSVGMRVTVIHRNIPSMLTQIASIISECGVNIENLTNKSKKDYAYTMVDVGGRINDGMIEKIRGIDGVIRVNLYR